MSVVVWWGKMLQAEGNAAGWKVRAGAENGVGTQQRRSRGACGVERRSGKVVGAREPCRVKWRHREGRELELP